MGCQFGIMTQSHRQPVQHWNLCRKFDSITRAAVAKLRFRFAFNLSRRTIHFALPAQRIFLHWCACSPRTYIMCVIFKRLFLLVPAALASHKRKSSVGIDIDQMELLKGGARRRELLHSLVRRPLLPRAIANTYNTFCLRARACGRGKLLFHLFIYFYIHIQFLHGAGLIPIPRNSDVLLLL